MLGPAKPIFLLTVALLCSPLQESAPPPTAGPEYTADGQLKLPEHYREWIYLSSDFYVSSDPAKAQMGPQKGFINVFVDPGAYQAFLKTGTWADKTMFVAEMRRAADMPSMIPSHNGSDQSATIGVAVHVKDTARFADQWAFFNFKGAKTAQVLPTTADCYSCHSARAALDNTFVQFYPTLLPTAQSKNTLSAAYKQTLETAATKAK